MKQLRIVKVATIWTIKFCAAPWQNSSPGLQNSPYGFNVKGAILQFSEAILQSRGAVLPWGYFAAQKLTVQTVDDSSLS